MYRLIGHPICFRQRLLAAVLAHGPDAVASHCGAAALWGLPGFSRPASVEITKPRGRNQRRSWGTVHGSLALPVHHVTTRHGIPVTTPARLAFDLAGTLHPRRTERTIDTMLSRDLTSPGALQVVFADLARRGRRGTVLMRELLEARGGGYVAPSAELEALGRAVLREGGLPEPSVERDLGGEEWVGRVDLLYGDARLVIELDSRRHHTALLNRESDRRRDNRLLVAGWRVLRFTWWDLVDRPADVVEQVRSVLAAAAPAVPVVKAMSI